MKWRQTAAVWVVSGSLAVAALAGSRSARAALGDTADSVRRDQAALRGTLSTTSLSAYDVHEIRVDASLTVREYATRGGPVFAVTWNGARAPELPLLLGTHFGAYAAAAAARHGGHHALSVDTPEMSITALRFQRSASGRVYLHSLLPRGVTRSEIR